MPRRNYDRDYDNYGQGDYEYGRQSGMGSYNRGYGQERFGGGYGNQRYENQRFGNQRYGNYGGSRYGNQGSYGRGYDRGYGDRENDYNGGEYLNDYGDNLYGENRGRMSSRSRYDRDYDDYDYGSTGGRYNRGYGRGGRYDTDYTGGGGYYGRGDYDRDFGRGSNREDRGWWERTSDEVSSWFGDEDSEQRRRMDRERGYRGRGPKNYTRSDERIKEDVSDELSDSYYLDASDIEVEVKNAEVTLNGTVNSRYAKREAEDLAEECSGVNHVQNNLRVESYETDSENKSQDATASSGKNAGKSKSATN